VVVPLILRLLSLFLPRQALLSAAEAVREAGSRAVDGMARSRRWMQGGNVAPDAEREGIDAAPEDHVRVDGGPTTRQVRVPDAPSDSATLEEESAAHEREPAGKRPA
jgi:hypothetical protein